MRCRSFSLFSHLSCFRQFVSACLQQIWVLCVSKSPLKRSNASRYLWGFGTQTARDGLLHLSPYWVNGAGVHRQRLVTKKELIFQIPLCCGWQRSDALRTTLPCVGSMARHLWTRKIHIKVYSWRMFFSAREDLIACRWTISDDVCVWGIARERTAAWRSMTCACGSAK